MTKKERIAELERKVAQLEAQALMGLFGSEKPTYVYPYWSVIPPTYGVIYCSRCGRAGNHICNPITWYTTTTSGWTGDDVHVYGNVTYIGATG
jgi:hypothetical protein